MELYAVDPTQQQLIRSRIQTALKQQLQGVDVGAVAEVYAALHPGQTTEDFAARWLALSSPPKGTTTP